VKQLCPLLWGVGRRQILERVPKYVIAGTNAVDWKIRLKHASLCAKDLDGVIEIATGSIE